jgi:ornithine cyclodeaminase/alanine dehydrogenase-like protein (mu-crystallin family)
MPAVVRVLSRGDIERLVTLQETLAAVREAFAAVDRGQAVMPPPFQLHLPDADGELHVKGAYLLGAPVFAVKTATGFYRKPPPRASGKQRDDPGV